MCVWGCHGHPHTHIHLVLYLVLFALSICSQPPTDGYTLLLCTIYIYIYIGELRLLYCILCLCVYVYVCTIYVLLGTTVKRRDEKKTALISRLFASDVGALLTIYHLVRM